ncbi:MAG: alpha-amylase [Phycisphaerae bacterium]|nr:alpha-amylase [Phycisphaerae bacterium]
MSKTRASDSDLDIIYGHLRTLQPRPRQKPYRIPAVWNCWGYEGARRSRRGEIVVAPYDYLLTCLQRVIIPARDGRQLAGRSLSQIRGVRRLAGGKVRDGRSRRRGGDWIRTASIYGMLVRTTTAWDHDGDGSLRPAGWTETGTFLKSILLLPLLARMGIDTIYLLPISKISQAFRKGEIGCPYSAKDFFEFEPELHDRLLDTGMSDLETEFCAFVESAHALGIRVMVDLAPRTASRDSDLILKHPDWFYWIDVRSARGYGPPNLDGCEPGIPKPSQLAGILRSDVIRSHLSKFRDAPIMTAPLRWRRFAARCRAKPPRDLLREVARAFGVITPPGFSDCINDPQPPWSDVTFLRLFLDHPVSSAKHLDDPTKQPPYVFTDTIKASKFPGRRPNRPLWKFLADILPFYQRFGVDGARVDMGHALPPALQRMIIDKPKREDPDFCFLAEELDHQGAAAARRDGYNAIIGSSWWMQPRYKQGELHRFVHEVLPATRLPAFAAAETPDTPRAATRDGGRGFVRMIAALNHFLPSAVPFLNSGLEMFERQPMNLGLDMQPPGRFALPRNDPYYGKLAYFDRVALHWTNAGVVGMVDLLARAAEVRRRFLADLVKARNYFAPRVSMNARKVIAVGWRVDAGKSALIIAANTDFQRRRRCVIKGLPAAIGRRRRCDVLLAIQRGGTPRIKSGKLRLSLEPGDLAVLLL